MQFLKKVFFRQWLLVIQMLKQDILQLADSLCLLFQYLVVKELTDLESDLSVLI